MENMKQSILELVGKEKKNTLNRSAIASRLGVTKSADFIVFDQAMDELEESWQLVRNKKNLYQTRTQAGFIEAVIHISRRGSGYIDLEDGTVLIPAEEQNQAMDRDLVLMKPYDGGTGTVLQVLRHARTHVTGTYVRTGSVLRCIPDDERIRNGKYLVMNEKSLTPAEGSRALLRIESYGSPLKLRPERIIGHADDPGMDILSLLLDSGIDPEFSEKAMREAEAMPQEVQPEDLKDRRDLRDILTITMDGAGSKDFDDAVSVRKTETGWQLLVSIADVSHYVRPGSALDQEAYERGFSVYVTDRVVPMLPHALSNGICSLNPQVDRLTLTCAMQVSSDGVITAAEIYPSVIHSDERMTYEDVNRIYDGDKALQEKYSHLLEMLTDLQACADAIRADRTRRGAIDFDTEEAEIIVDENGHPTEVRARVRGAAERVIEDCMIAANVSVARFMHANAIPSVYRIHEEPQLRKLKAFEQLSFRLGCRFVRPRGETVRPKDLQDYLLSCREEDQYEVLSRSLLRCMQKARYDSVCAGHFGIAEEEYLHFTSPIRRYPDLIVHRMLWKYAFAEGGMKKDRAADEAAVQEIAAQASMRERISADAEWAVTDMKKAEYMADHIGQQYEGIISSVTGFGFYVLLGNTIEGLVRVQSLSDDYYHYDEEEGSLIGRSRGNTYRLGQKVRIRVVAADKNTRTIDFELVQSGKKPMKKASSGSQNRRRKNRPGRRERHGRKK